MLTVGEEGGGFHLADQVAEHQIPFTAFDLGQSGFNLVGSCFLGLFTEPGTLSVAQSENVSKSLKWRVILVSYL